MIDDDIFKEPSLQDLDELSTLEVTADLRKKYPRAIRSIVKRCFPWVLSYFVFIVAVSIVFPEDSSQSLLPHLHAALTLILVNILFAAKFFLVLKDIYEVLYHLAYQYSIEEGHIVITRGVFLKKRGSFPLDSVTDVSLDRGVLEFLFGLYSLHITTPSNESTPGLTSRKGLLSITDLPAKVGVKLQDRINRELLRVNPNLNASD